MGGRGASSSQLSKLEKRANYAYEQYSKYAKSANYTNKFRDEMDYWNRIYNNARKEYSEALEKINKRLNRDLPF